MNVKESFKNSISSFIGYIVAVVIGFIAQAIFIKILGTEYLGLNGLFTNIISMLGIVELGVGSAIIYNLYKPMEKGDKETVKSLMAFYKKAYNVIAVVVLFIGLILIPFLPSIIDYSKVTININITLVYVLFLIDIVCSYLLSYKRSILYADEKSYIINLLHMTYLIALNFVQLFFLYLTKNYYLYLIIKIIMRILENVAITSIVDKHYSYVNEEAESLDKKISDDILKKIKALFFHKIGGFIISGTDNIVISKYLGLMAVGLYANYYLVISSLNSLFGQVINALTPSIGHMLVKEDKEKSYNVFKKIRFLNFWIATFSGVGLLIVMDPFIKIWLGEKYLLNKLVLYVLVFNYYQKMMRYTYSDFKEAAGIYYEDRFVPLVESTMNIVFSIIFVKIMGLPGVFLGTIISGLALWCYSYPKYVYKKLFNRNYFNYFIETISYIILFILIAFISNYITNKIIVTSNFLQVIINILIALIIPNIIIIVLFNKTENFKYFENLFKKGLKKFKKA